MQVPGLQEQSPRTEGKMGVYTQFVSPAFLGKFYEAAVTVTVESATGLRRGDVRLPCP